MKRRLASLALGFLLLACGPQATTPTPTISPVPTRAVVGAADTGAANTWATAIAEAANPQATVRVASIPPTVTPPSPPTMTIPPHTPIVLPPMVLPRNAPVGYPYARYPPLSAADLALRQAAFVKRNGSHWQVVLDDFGYVRELSSRDPRVVSQSSPDLVLSEPERARWESFIRDNADFFGIDHPNQFELRLDPLDTSSRVPHRWASSVQVIDGADDPHQRVGALQPPGIAYGPTSPRESAIVVRKDLLGYGDPASRASLQMEGHFWPGARLPPSGQTIPASDIVTAVASQPFWFVEIHYPHPCSPPTPPTGSGDPCADPTAGTFLVSTKLAIKQVHVRLSPGFVQLESGKPIELRYLWELSVSGLDCSPGCQISDNGRIIDAMTGEDLTRYFLG